jgi:hypothetical protein
MLITKTYIVLESKLEFGEPVKNLLKVYELEDRTKVLERWNHGPSLSVITQDEFVKLKKCDIL